MDKEKALSQLREFNKAWYRIAQCYDDEIFLSTEGRVLYYMIEQESMGEEATQKGLCEVWMMNKKTIHSAVKRMEKMGYIIRIDSATDKRKKLLILTDRGRELAKEAIVPLRIAELSAFEKMTEAEGKRLGELMNKFEQYLRVEAAKYRKEISKEENSTKDN